jgi:hypothetical protein
MSRPAIHNEKLNQHLTLSECHPDSECRTINWWLYDDRAYGGMNIGMRAKTRDEALVEAIEFWAGRAIKAEQAHAQLKSQVNNFVGQFVEPEDD